MNKKISFCISTMNRLGQLSQTLIENLAANKKYQKQIEFVLVNFINKEDGVKTDKWIRKNFKNEIKSNYLRYYITDKMQYFHMSIAKNTTHQNATGEFLINLDADNFILPQEIQYLLSNQKLHHSFVHFFDGHDCNGTHGKIGLNRNDFIKIGGYNESFKPRQYEDDDLIYRYLAFYKNTSYKKYYAINKIQMFRISFYRKNILKLHQSISSRIMFRLIKLLLIWRNYWDKFEYLNDYPKQKTPLNNSDEERIENLFKTDINDYTKENYSIANIKIAEKLTNNYTENLVQEKIGVEVIRIDENNIDDYFLGLSI